MIGADATITLSSIAGGFSNIQTVLLNVLNNGVSIPSYSNLNITSSIASFQGQQYKITGLARNSFYNIRLTISNSNNQTDTKEVSINTNINSLTNVSTFTVFTLSGTLINITFPNQSSISPDGFVKRYTIKIVDKNNNIKINNDYNVSKDGTNATVQISALALLPFDSGYRVKVSSFDLAETDIGTIDTTDLNNYSWKWVETDCGCEVANSSFVGYTKGSYVCHYKGIPANDKVGICNDLYMINGQKIDMFQKECTTYRSKCPIIREVVLSGSDIFYSPVGTRPMIYVGISNSGLVKTNNNAPRLKNITCPDILNGKNYQIWYYDGSYVNATISNRTINTDSTKLFQMLYIYDYLYLYPNSDLGLIFTAFL